MTLSEGVLFFIALVGFISALVMKSEKDKTEYENDYLRDSLQRLHCKVLEYRQIIGIKDGKRVEFFDFEKVNGKEEK